MKNLWSLFTVFLLFSGNVFAQETSADKELEFYSSIQDAIDSTESPKPMVLYFGASWCGPCQRMRSTTFELLGNEAAAHKYLWVKHDIDQSAAVASRYGVVSVPTMIVLDEAGNPIGGSTGFMTVKKVLSFVENAIKNPAALPLSLSQLANDIEDAEESEIDGAVDVLISELSSAEQIERAGLLRIVKEQKQKIKLRLLELLEDKQLKTRAAACLALFSSHDLKLEFDPFAAPAKRKAQSKAIQELLLAKEASDAG